MKVLSRFLPSQWWAELEMDYPPCNNPASVIFTACNARTREVVGGVNSADRIHVGLAVLTIFSFSGVACLRLTCRQGQQRRCRQSPPPAIRVSYRPRWEHFR